MTPRRWGCVVVALCAAGALLFIFAAAFMITSISSSVSPDAGNAGGCDTVVTTDDTTGPPTSPVSLDDLDAEQKRNAQLIIAIGRERGLPPRAWQIALQAGMTESRLHNLNYGDRDSLGIFQMRPSQGWGTPDQVTDPVYAINKFYDVMLEVPDWKTDRPGDVAQAVERSAFPTRYHQWERMAVELVEVYDDAARPAACTQPLVPASQVAGRAIEYALAQRGKPYIWGAEGPEAFDCSGLMMRAYEHAGVPLPRVSYQQYHAGSHVLVQQAQPGDLLFWAYDSSDPDTIHHVALYLGDNKIVEAQKPGVPVHVRSVSFDEDEMVPLATRPGVSSM